MTVRHQNRTSANQVEALGAAPSVVSGPVPADAWDRDSERSRDTELRRVMTGCHPSTRHVSHRWAMSFLAEIRYSVGSIAARAVEFALPVACAGCYHPGTTLCRDCRTALKVRLAAGSGEHWGSAAAVPGVHQLEWCGRYDGMTRRVLDRLSCDGERHMSEPLGTAIASRWVVAGMAGEALVPVPASPDRVREIGYDHTLELARVAGRRLGLPVTEALLHGTAGVPTRSSEPAGPRPPAGRAFEVIAASRITGRSVVLVDDVVVSGATLATCAAALLAAGARMVSAITVAWDQAGTSKMPEGTADH
jgi:predicted amidophosphoribosyltransferase